jgi:hypothetical protein
LIPPRKIQRGSKKKGWLRIVEAVISILLISGVLLSLYSANADKFETSSYALNVQKELLRDVYTDETLRRAVLNNSVAKLDSYLDANVRYGFTGGFEVCDLGLSNSCIFDREGMVPDLEEVFVEDTIIAAEYDVYSPKEVRLYLWLGN